MISIKFKTADGSEHKIAANPGESLMEVALNAGLPGMEGQCGGFLNCATCHVYIDEDWIDQLPPPDNEEKELLDGTVEPRSPNSRLGCQIKTSSEIDGISITLPRNQS